MSRSKSKPNKADDLGRAYLDSLPQEIRKARGIYYTPQELARAICEAAAAWLPSRETFLDPACGAGAFLCAAYEAGFSHVCGADIDPGAIEVARQALGAAWPADLAVGDSLSGLDFEAAFPSVASGGGFDLVATNPPYVRADRNPEIVALRRELAAGPRFRSLRHRWDLAVAFIELSMGLLRPGGIGIFLLPATYLRAQYGRTQHQWLEREHEVLDVRLLPGSWFPDAAVASAILLVRAGRATNPAVPPAGPALPGRPVSLYGSGTRPGTGGMPSPERRWLRPLGELCFVSYGLRANSDEKRWPGEFVTSDLLSPVPDATHPRGYAEGKDLGGLRVLRTRYLEWGTERAPGRFARRSFPEFLEAAPKILALCISGREVRAALDQEGRAFNHTAVGIVPWSALEGVSNVQVAKAARGIARSAASEVDIRYLLAVLHGRRIREALWQTRRSDKHIYPDDLRNVLVPIASLDVQSKIARAVDGALALPYPSAEFDGVMRRIQELVDEAYLSVEGR